MSKVLCKSAKNFVQKLCKGANSLQNTCMWILALLWGYLLLQKLSQEDQQFFRESLYYRLRDSNSILSGIHLAHSNYCSSTFIQNFPLSFLSIYVTVVWSFSHIQDLIFHPFLKFCISHVHLHKSSKPLASQILNLLNSRRLSIFFH